MPNKTLIVSLTANLHYSSLVRGLADEAFGVAGFNKAWRSRLKLVVDELFMNAVKYGSTENQSTVKMMLEHNETEAKFMIEDDGTGPKSVDVDELKKIIENNHTNQELTKTSGRGLAMITSLWTDRFEIEKSSLGGVAVWFTKKIEDTVPPSPVAAAMASPIVVPTGPVITLKMTNDIGQYNIEEFVRPLYGEVEKIPANATLELDMTAVDYINSTFIGHLAAWTRTVLGRHGAIRLKGTNNSIKDVLDLVGLSRVLIFI